MITVYEMNSRGDDLRQLTDAQLIALIVASVEAALIDPPR
jgi:hypothetical protein